MEPQQKAKSSSEVIILLVSGSCCMPGMAVIDQQAQQVIRQALDDTGIAAQVRILPISSALQGGIPLEILKEMGGSSTSTNLMRLPALFVNGQLVSFGVPDLDQTKSALRFAQSEITTKEENES